MKKSPKGDSDKVEFTKFFFGEVDMKKSPKGDSGGMSFEAAAFRYHPLDLKAVFFLFLIEFYVYVINLCQDFFLRCCVSVIIVLYFSLS